MKHILILSAAVLTAGCMAQEPVELSERTQTKLAKELAGRVAGPPQSCVNYRDLRGNRSAGDGAIVFDTRDRDLIYVNRPPGGCPELGLSRALVTRSPTSQLCAGHIADVVDVSSNTSWGGCSLGEFTPYRRVR